MKSQSVAQMVPSIQISPWQSSRQLISPSSQTCPNFLRIKCKTSICLSRCLERNCKRDLTAQMSSLIKNNQRETLMIRILPWLTICQTTAPAWIMEPLEAATTKPPKRTWWWCRSSWSHPLLNKLSRLKTICNSLLLLLRFINRINKETSLRMQLKKVLKTRCKNSLPVSRSSRWW